MLSTLKSISALLLSFGIICVGHSLGTTLLGVRANIEGFPAWGIGLMSSGYFAGFIIGVYWCRRMLPVVGHIRVFSALASLASAVSLLHLLMMDLWSWILLRTLYGVCLAGLYMVIESWLLALAPRQYRSRILSTYLIINFLCLGTGQFLFTQASPDGYTLFVLTSITISLALIPLTLSRSRQPETGNAIGLSLRVLYERAPLSIVGCLITGMLFGSYWGLTALYLSTSGLSPQEVATAFAAGFAGGLLVQWPVGMLSDHYDRRYTIAAMLVLGICSASSIALAMQYGLRGYPLYVLMLVFGGTAYTLYSLFVALAHDQLDAEHVLSASGTLIMVHAGGAIFGPLLTGLAMYALGRNSFFHSLALFCAVLLVYTAIRLRTGHAPVSGEAQADFVALPRSTPVLAELDVRVPEDQLRAAEQD